MSILSQILETKRREVARLKQKVSAEDLRAEAALSHTPRGFVRALAEAPAPAIIAEIKRASPSRGPIRSDLDPVETARAYVSGGARCLSVLTDEEYFSGSLDFIPAINLLFERERLSAVPLLRKDFIIDPTQVWQTRGMGADALLLIVAALNDAELLLLAEESIEASLDILIEVHDEEELERAIAVLKRSAGATGLTRMALGINNRNLHTFQTELRTTERLAARLQRHIESAPALADTLLVSESGIFTAEDLQLLAGYGAEAFLVGEALVAQGDPGDNLAAMIAAYRG